MEPTAIPPELDEGFPPFICTLCGLPKEGEKADDAGRCLSCRQEVIRRSGRWALVPAVVMAALYLWMIVWFRLIESPAMIFFLALGAALAFVAYKVARRVAFDLLVVRGRGARKR
jgi:hypothetical protein